MTTRALTFVWQVQETSLRKTRLVNLWQWDIHKLLVHWPSYRVVVKTVPWHGVWIRPVFQDPVTYVHITHTRPPSCIPHNSNNNTSIYTSVHMYFYSNSPVPYCSLSGYVYVILPFLLLWLALLCHHNLVVMPNWLVRTYCS